MPSFLFRAFPCIPWLNLLPRQGRRRILSCMFHEMTNRHSIPSPLPGLMQKNPCICLIDVIFLLYQSIDVISWAIDPGLCRLVLTSAESFPGRLGRGLAGGLAGVVIPIVMPGVSTAWRASGVMSIESSGATSGGIFRGHDSLRTVACEASRAVFSQPSACLKTPVFFTENRPGPPATGRGKYGRISASVRSA